jgi:hypothetical protein
MTPVLTPVQRASENLPMTKWQTEEGFAIGAHSRAGRSFEMRQADDLYRALIILGVGIVFFIFIAAQIWSGKAFRGFGCGLWHSPWALRTKQPALFWFSIFPIGVVTAFAIGLGLAKLAEYYS